VQRSSYPHRNHPHAADEPTRAHIRKEIYHAGASASAALRHGNGKARRGIRRGIHKLGRGARGVVAAPAHLLPKRLKTWAEEEGAPGGSAGHAHGRSHLPPDIEVCVPVANVYRSGGRRFCRLLGAWRSGGKHRGRLPSVVSCT
jgi:hypothetical protein